ncbi:hypothetical protein AB5J55_35375 [Streptomyces sp. R11]|uniref:Uncharacterized protein n=1 Tax=Streptomyces sp. R11 TaxID=3238625 RepID=A0AB39NAR2_9ACTN
MGGPLKRYEVTTPHGVKTTMKLNETDARRLGVLDEPEQDGTEEAAPAPAKKRTVSNKSRTAASKGGAGGGDD